MSKRQELLSFFAGLDKEEVLRLSLAQKNELLSMLHSEVTQGVIVDKMHKTKPITKSRRVNYKSFVRRRIPMIMGRLAARVAAGSMAGGAAEGRKDLKSGLGEPERRKVEKFQTHFKQIGQEQNREDLICPICLELLMSPVLTSCGHAFCYQCLDSSLIFSSVCPNCRENIKGGDVIVCPLLENYVRTTVKACLPKIYPGYRQRARKMQEWRSKREVQLRGIRVGNLVDVRDTENIWCQGTVLDIFYEGEIKDTPTSILVHFNRWHKIYNQILELPNSRIAPLFFFSGRTDIPRYNLSLEDNNMRGLVVSGAPIVPNLGNILDSDSSESQEAQQDLIPIVIRPPQTQHQSSNIMSIVMQNWAARLFQGSNYEPVQEEEHNNEAHMQVQQNQSQEQNQQGQNEEQNQYDDI